MNCKNCKYNKEARNLGENVQLCTIPLPIGIQHHNRRIHDEKKQGCVLGEYKK